MAPLQVAQGSMPEVPHSRKDHRHAQLVGSVDDILIFHGTAGLDNGCRSCLGDGFQAVGEGEEGV
jgi:hypothetical protein